MAVVRAWIYLLFTLICFGRVWYLFRLSTASLRAPRIPTTHTIPADVDRSIPISMGAEPKGIFYFVQISDLHISKFRPKGHTHYFLHFIRSILPVLKPSFVVVTGDLTDAKDMRRVTSQQYVEEWSLYNYAIDQGVQGTRWYDMRGNHDCFDLPSWKSRANLYRTHGQSASLIAEGGGIYAWEERLEYGRYKFIAIDACPKKGPSRPLNFFGYLTSKAMDQLASHVLSDSYNHTFMFSHYPTTTMVFGLGDILQAYHPSTQSLELELGDLKEHGLYRIVAIDHDLISFVDTPLPSAIMKSRPERLIPLDNTTVLWPHAVDIAPVVLITNPKEARFSIPAKEPLEQIQKSTHLRFLVFSSLDPSQLQVSIWIDNIEHIHPAEFVGNQEMPLWVAKWDPSSLELKELHTIRVQVDTPTMIGSSSIEFRLDNQRTKVNGGTGEWIISTHMTSTVRFCFSTSSF
ncbi:Metallo-dependent phosphatase-like protein [Phycomyces blakesleeanus]|uniref:Metallo-dependent phosphatase-like protein n=1 Tax=Phycomyces blakesleeanus TaxID=4837 RepID=A0ABR3AX28_PHYBL